MNCPLIGERVTKRTPAGSYDGTIVDIVNAELVKVYWREPLLHNTQLRSHHPRDLERKQ